MPCYQIPLSCTSQYIIHRRNHCGFPPFAFYRAGGEFPRRSCIDKWRRWQFFRHCLKPKGFPSLHKRIHFRAEKVVQRHCSFNDCIWGKECWLLKDVRKNYKPSATVSKERVTESSTGRERHLFAVPLSRETVRVRGKWTRTNVRVQQSTRGAQNIVCTVTWTQMQLIARPSLAQ